MSPPWMPLYIADYLRDTRRLSLAEHGAYLLLIMEYWTSGSLPNDDRQLARIVGSTPGQWSKIKPAMKAFFQDGWKHKRIDGELARAAEISSKRRASAEQRHNKSSANAEQLDTHAGASSPSQSPKKDKIAADAASNGNGKYEFESGIIRLTAKDFDKWQKAFSHLDLAAELTGLTKWAGDQGPENWFFAVSGALAKRNRELKKQTDLARRGGPQLPLTPSGNRWPEGIT